MLLSAPLAALFLAHVGSVSLSTLYVEQQAAHLHIRAQAASFTEVLPELDLDGDDYVSDLELAAGAEDVARYVAEHFAVAANTSADLTGGSPLRPDLSSALVESWTDERVQVPLLRDWFAIDLPWVGDEPIDTVAVGSELFRLTSPDHIAYVSVEMDRGAEGSLQLTPDQPRARFDPRGRYSSARYAELGLRDLGKRPIVWVALWGFALALALGTRTIRSVALYGLAATIAAAATLYGHRNGHWNALQYSRELSAALALALAYVGVDRLAFRTDRARRAPWIEAVLFGVLTATLWSADFARTLREEWAPVRATAAFGLTWIGAACALTFVVAAILRRAGKSALRWLGWITWPSLVAWGFWVFARDL